MPSRLSYVWLSLKRGLGSRTAAEVLDAFGSPEAVFAADRQALTAAPCELRKTHVDLLCDKDTSEAEQVIRSCTEKNIQIITIGDSAYPDRLRAIPDPPTVLYVRGRWPDFDSVPAVAVVGTRKATPYGLKVADQIGTTLARAGMITVSGMALGNDGAAHRGALKAGGLTVAVLAQPDGRYPAHGCHHQRISARHRAARTQLPPAQPHYQRPVGRVRHRGGERLAFGCAHYRASRA